LDFTANREPQPNRKERGCPELVNDLHTNLVINKEVIKGLIEAQSSQEPF
jgi:hypothetical protein